MALGKVSLFVNWLQEIITSFMSVSSKNLRGKSKGRELIGECKESECNMDAIKLVSLSPKRVEWWSYNWASMRNKSVDQHNTCVYNAQITLLWNVKQSI